MAGEKYIERLQREKKELKQYVTACNEYDDAVYFLSITGKKGTAKQEVDRRLALKNEAFKLIEPIMAEKED